MKPKFIKHHLLADCCLWTDWCPNISSITSCLVASLYESYSSVWVKSIHSWSASCQPPCCTSCHFTSCFLSTTLLYFLFYFGQVTVRPAVSWALENKAHRKSAWAKHVPLFVPRLQVNWCLYWCWPFFSYWHIATVFWFVEHSWSTRQKTPSLLYSDIGKTFSTLREKDLSTRKKSNVSSLINLYYRVHSRLR